MSQAAEKLDREGLPLGLVAARIVAQRDEHWMVGHTDGLVAARRAAGCLLEPTVGDRVLVARGESEAWILNVLERSGDEARRISVDGDLEMVTEGGRIRLHAKDGIDLGTPGTTRLTSGRLEVTVLSARVLARQLHALGERAKSEFSRVEVVAESVETLADRVRQRAKRVMRFVEGLDQLRAGHIDTRAEGLARSHAADQVVTADSLVKVDGKQVHIG